MSTKEGSTVSCLSYLQVLDDGAQILEQFSSEMEEIESNYRSIANLQPLQVVVASSTWLQSLETVFSTLQESKIFTCSIEAALRAKVDMVSTTENMQLHRELTCGFSYATALR